MNFMRFKFVYFAISALFILPGIYFLLTAGLKLSIDFSGGTLLEVKFIEPVSELDNEKILTTTEGEVEIFSIQQTSNDTFLLRLPPLEREQVETIKTGFAVLSQDLEEVRLETIGPTLGRELLIKTLVGVGLAATFILAFIAWRFKQAKFGICAILAMFHDTLILIGSFAILGHFYGVEIDALFVTAVLTILSFSVHDTVVVYDRIRESQKLYPKMELEILVNKAVTETLVRSLNNSLTIIFMLVALLLLGGETIRWFVVALLIGTVAGTYSSTFTAAPLLIVWDRLTRKLKR